MIKNENRKKVIVVMPAYNAATTLERTFLDIPSEAADQIILVDDGSHDNTVEIANRLGITVIRHEKNKGYGGNQKTCYREALARGADVVVMLHPDYQYDSRLIPFFLGYLNLGICDVMLGNRIRSRHEALKGGMPLYKYVSNRALTILENVVLGQNLGDFHSGFRVYRREVLERIPFESNSNDFAFDSELLAQAAYLGFRIGDAPVPVRYFAEASSIDFRRSLLYGLKTLWVLLKYVLQRWRIIHCPLFTWNHASKDVSRIDP
jgi:glycosyltransferase involved in cell wall biosynthesis